MKNWRTTVTGIAAAAPQIAEGVATKNWSLLVSGIATLLMGIFAKDSNVTGGTVIQ